MKNYGDGADFVKTGKYPTYTAQLPAHLTSGEPTVETVESESGSAGAGSGALTRAAAARAAAAPSGDQNAGEGTPPNTGGLSEIEKKTAELIYLEEVKHSVKRKIQLQQDKPIRRDLETPLRGVQEPGERSARFRGSRGRTLSAETLDNRGSAPPAQHSACEQPC